MANHDYERYQEDTMAAYESLCKCCGICCGAADNDPCVHLVKREDGRFHCDIYSTRFGVQKTVGGKEFTCVAIRDVINFGVQYDGCGYNG